MVSGVGQKPHPVQKAGAAHISIVKMPEQFGIRVRMRQIENNSLKRAIKLTGNGDSATGLRVDELHRKLAITKFRPGLEGRQRPVSAVS